MRRSIAALALSLALLTTTTVQAQDDEAEASPSIIPLVIGGAGVLFLGLGVVFSLQASGAEDDAAAAMDHMTAFDHAESARSATNTANLMYLTGATLLLVGVGWFSVELTDADQRNAVALGIGPGTLALRGAF